MSTSAERQASLTITAYRPETQKAAAAKPQQTADDESYRAGCDIYASDSGNAPRPGEDSEEADRDGGDLQSRDSGTGTSTKEDAEQTNGSRISPDDVERGT